MKRKGARLLALLMLLTLLPGMALAASFAVVRGGKLNLRAGASSSSRSLGLYGTGSWVRVDGNAGNGWYYVATMDGRQGYMAGNYLNFGASTNEATVRYANGGYVNLRSGPSMDAGVIMRVTSGTQVAIQSSVGDWDYILVRTNGAPVYGYMLRAFLDSGTMTSTVTTRNGGKVNVRSGPSSRYSSVGSLPSGTRVTVLLKGNGWYHISGGGLAGFMSTSYLSGSGATAGSNTGSGGTTTSQTAYVNNPLSTQVLNLRETPSQSARSIGQYRNGTQVKVVRYDPTWCEVYVGTRHGYMMTRYLSFSYVSPVLYDQSAAEQGTLPLPTVQAPVATQIPVVTQPVVMNTPVPSGQNMRSVGATVTLTSSTGTVDVFRDAALSQVLTSVASGTQATMLTYGDTTCMVLVPGQNVGHVLTQYVR